jgi:hypothetical protein
LVTASGGFYSREASRALHKGKQPDRVIGGVAAEEQVSGLSVVSAVSVIAFAAVPVTAFAAVSLTALLPRGGVSCCALALDGSRSD